MVERSRLADLKSALESELLPMARSSMVDEVRARALSVFASSGLHTQGCSMPFPMQVSGAFMGCNKVLRVQVYNGGIHPELTVWVPLD
jgi:hypothetical protein